MQKIRNGLLLVAALLIGIIGIVTCNTKTHNNDSGTSELNTRILNQWKAERKALAIKYQNEINVLQEENISLKEEAQTKKQHLSAYRLKASILEDQLKKILSKADSSNIFPNSALEVAQSYFEVQALNDTTCDQTITVLETQVANRDSVIVIQNHSLSNFRDLEKEQDMRTQLLDEELNTAYKAQKKKIRQNRLLTCGMVFISGITTTVLIKQKIK
jgi:hypothetical protein